MKRHLTSNPPKDGIHIGGKRGVSAEAGSHVLSQSVRTVTAETGAFIAVVFSFDALPLFIKAGAYSDAQCVDWAHKADKLFELAAVQQMRPAQDKSAPFQVLKTRINGPALAVERA